MAVTTPSRSQFGQLAATSFLIGLVQSNKVAILPYMPYTDVTCHKNNHTPQICHTTNISNTVDEKLRVYELIRRVDSHFPLWAQIQRSEIRSKDTPLKVDDLIESLQEQHQSLTHSVNIAKQDNRKRSICSYCKKPNHTEATCYRKHPHLQPKKENRGSRADKGDKPISTSRWIHSHYGNSGDLSNSFE